MTDYSEKFTTLNVNKHDGATSPRKGGKKREAAVQLALATPDDRDGWLEAIQRAEQLTQAGPLPSGAEADLDGIFDRMVEELALPAPQKEAMRRLPTATKRTMLAEQMKKFKSIKLNAE